MAKVIDAIWAVRSIEGAAVEVGTWMVGAGTALAVLGSLLAIREKIG